MATPYLTEPLSEAGKVMVGPVVAEDGITLSTARTIAAADIEISKNNAPFAVRAVVAPDAVLDKDGFYHVELGADDLVSGHVVVKIKTAGYLLATRKFTVLAVPQ